MASKPSQFICHWQVLNFVNNYRMKTSRLKNPPNFLLCQSTPAVLAQKQENKPNSGVLSRSDGNREVRGYRKGE